MFSQTRYMQKIQSGCSTTKFNIPNVVSYWNLNCSAFDYVGANSGTFTDGMPFSQGKVGDAINFTKGTDVVAIPPPSNDSLSFSNGTNDIPKSGLLWFKPTSNNQGIWFFGKRDNDTTKREWQFIWLSNRVQLYIFDASGNTIYAQSTSFPLVFNSWTCVGFTYDGSGLASGIDIYINGVNQTQNRIGSYTGARITDSQLFLGDVGFNSTVGDLIGQLQEVSIWDKQLSVSEILNIYNGNNSGIPLPQIDLAA